MNWEPLIRRQPQFVEKSKEYAAGWIALLKKNSGFASECDKWEEFSVSNWEFLLSGKPRFEKKAKEYKKILDLKANDKVRDTFYTEILDIIAAYESGLAEEIKRKSEQIGRVLSVRETEGLFHEFEQMTLWKPLIQRGRIKMASRDMALRDAFHYQLSEYIQPLDADEYQKFLGAAGDELERLMQENQEVLRRLKERD